MDNPKPLKIKTTGLPGEGSLVSLTDEDACFIGRLPLDKFKTLLEKKASEGLINLDLHCIGYVTDAAVKVIKDVLSSKSEYLEKLVTIDVTGCFNVTDVGAAWIADIASQSPNLLQVRVDGCAQITDSGFTALYNAKPGVSVSAMATSVSFINLGASMRGCPLLTDTKGKQEKTDLMYSQCLVVSHSGLDTSMADYLSRKKVESCNGRPLCHVTDWKNGDWRISLNELELSNPLFDVIAPHNPTQVLIPFDASADVREIRTHVANTITRVLSKETINPGHKIFKAQKSQGSVNFMDVLTLQKVDFTLDGLLKNISTSEQVIGAFCSRQPLSRSNNYFEVEVVSTDGTKELGIVLGCMFDVLYSDRTPMEANEKKGGAVDGFEIAAGEVYGFGVGGRWDSEYVPSEDSSYYYTKNGAIVTDKVPADSPHIGMFPLCSIIGKGLAEVRIKNINAPPKALVDQWEKEKKIFQPSFMHNMLCDDTGVLSYIDSYKNVGETGLCVNMLPVTALQNSLTVKLLAEATDGSIRVGIGPESYRLRSRVGSNETTGGYSYARRVPSNTEASIGYEFSSGEVFSSGKSGDKKGPVLKVGDELTVTVTEQQNKLIQPDDTVTVCFTVNGKKDSAVETTFKYTAKTGNRCVFLISMSKAGEQLLVTNYRKPFINPPPKMNTLTMARSHFINVLDDGRLSYRQFDQRNMFGLFVSKTPFNKNLCEFKILVEGISKNKHIGIGLCHCDYKINTMPGWMYGAIGYHADNGKLYHCSSHGKYTINKDVQSVIFGAGDTVGCHINPEKTEFREDGSIKPQQTLIVYFTKNGTEVHEEKFQYQSDGLFPCVALHHDGDAVQLLNYFHGCQPIPEKKEVEKKTEKKEEEKEGCEFVLVSVGSGAVDEKSKLELLKNQLSLDSDISSISLLSEEVSNIEKKLESLDFQGQNYYSGLCWSLQCLERVCRQKDRLHFLSLNTKTGEGYEKLVKKICSIQSAHKEKYSNFYNIHTSVKEGLDKLLAVVESQCIVRVSKLQQLTENVFEGYGHVYKQAVKVLHNRGKLVCFKLLDSDHVAVDPTFLQRMFERAVSVDKGHTDRRITAVGEGSLFWTEETITSATKLEEDQLYLLKQLLLQMGFLQLPCLRTEPTDPQFLYSKLGKISSTVSLADYWSKGSRQGDTVVMWRTYQFPAGVPAELLSTVLTLCSRYAQVQLVTKEGGVLKNGAVQTTIIAHKTDGRVEAVTMESKCYVPDVDEGPINDDTRYFVQEYTWNVFCVLSDVVDSHLGNCGLTPIIKQEIPTWFANTSVGCKHEWVFSDADIVQSVCTLCEKCCDQGSECPWNGIMGRYLRQCPCETRVTGCKSCGICKQCAQLLWKLRSRLRPCCEVTRGDGREILDAVPLNGFTFNQVECINLHVNNQPICLRKLNDPTAALIQIYPGPAVNLPTMKRLTDYNKTAKFNKAMQFNPGDTVTVTLQEIKKDESQLLEMEQAEEDTLEIRPVYYTCICREARVSHETGIVCYDSGSASIPVAQFVGARPLSAECNKFSIEVVNPGKGRYIALGLVAKRYQMNRQPGWDSASIGYHADDGGIFVGSGWPLQRVGKVDVGEVMTCELDLDTNKVTFYKGDQKVYQSSRIRIPAGGFHPCVALHSQGEALRLLDFDAWLPPKEGEVTTLPQAFDTYKYGNLWISPGHTISLQQSNVTQGWLILHNPSKDLVGYLVKSNPAGVDIVGQMDPGKTNPTWVEITEVALINSLEIVWFTLDSGRSYSQEDIQNVFKTLTTESYHTHKLKVKIQRSQQAEVINLDRTAEREPDATDMYLLEVKRNGSRLDTYYLKRGKYTCRMPLDSDIGRLGLLMYTPAFPTFDQPNMFQRGMRLIAQPSLNTYAECVIADVSFDGYALTLEYSPKGEDDNTLLCVEMTSDAIQLEELPLEVIEEMSTVIKGDKDAKKEDKGDKPVEPEKVEKSEQEKESEKLASADIFSDSSDYDDDDDFLGIDSFSPFNKSKKSQEDNVDNAKPEEPAKKKQEKKEIVKADVEIYGYESRGNMAVEKRAYMFPPPCLLNSASRYAIMALDSKWRVNSLESIAKCYSVPTRITVQELQITELSRKLLRWLDNRRKERRIDQAFVFLPAQLDAHKLCHFQVPQLFTDIEVHRLCYLVDQIYQMWREEDEMTLDLPIHFVDTPPIKPQTSLPAHLMYACLMSGWNYSSLTATQLVLPVYDKIFSGAKPDYSRQEVESLLWSLLRVYTSQCHILAEQSGGMELQDACPKRTKDINKAVAYKDVNVQRSTGTLVDDPSIMVIRKFKNSCMCKAHQLTFEGGMVVEMPDFPYEHKYFEPYQENVNYFCRELHNQDSLPSDFFAKFPNLQLLALDLCSNLTSLPSGVSQCSRLKIVSLSTSAIKELPSDIFLSPSLSQLQCSYLPVKSLPTEWPASSQLTKLTLYGLQLTQIPPEICQLQELQTLNLSCNPLSDIPVEIGKLQKLKRLDLSGMPWPTLGGDKTVLLRDQFEEWFADHSFVKNFLTKFDAYKMFVEHDHNKSGVLDEEGLASLNVKLFLDIPRIGCNSICDTEYGGIPSAIFLLTSLEELYLDYNAITAVPVHMCRLVNLHVLSLSYNPLLESLPGSLGHLPNIKTLNLMGCPSLRTPPNEVVSRGFESVKAYLKRLAGGFTACRRTKLMLVGLGGAGKTSLLKALMSQNKKTEGTKGEDITDGIVIQPWTVKTPAGLDITFNTWDFAGQTLYYNTHQFFLSKRAVYILLWSTRQGFEHAGLEFWLSSIDCHAPKTPIFVVGTHCDQVPKADIPTAELSKRYPQIVGFHFVSSIQGTGIAELEERLLEVTLEQKNMGEKIPQVWLNLEHKILAARPETSILKWSVIKDYGMEVGIYDEKDIKEAIQFLHELGTVQYFDNDFLRDKVVINPQWIVNVMSCVVSVKDSPIQAHKGRFRHEDIQDIWKQYPKSLHKWLLQLTEEFDLTFPLPKDPINIVPCLLPQEEPEELDSAFGQCCGDNRQTKMVYKFAYLPAGLFNRAQVRLFQFSDGKLIWKRGSLLNKNNHIALIKQTSDSELVVLVQGPRPENILFLVHEIFESLIEEFFHGVKYDFMVPCPDCLIKEGCLDPCFDAELISHAKDKKAPFLQCRKYFHTVSMAQLLEIMPNNHAGDFDAHLQHSIMMLQELNSALTMDVAILYSSADIPAPSETGEKIHPAWVKEDLEKLDLSCWYCDDMLNVSIQDLTLALKNCKVVVALVSDNFERDEKCRDMMMYTMDSLNKEYIITLIGNSLAWQNTDLGMRIGKQEQMVMIKTKSRYKDRIQELQDAVKNKLHGIQMKDNKEYPVCFISYCWANSHDAVKKGTKEKPGALGWGDPRKIKHFLEKNGVSTWIDCEQMSAGKGLFENICQGMRHARVLVVCVSDEYIESENCMMEIRFGVLNLNLPLVLVVVGTGKNWKQSEVGILAMRGKADRVYLQQESPSALDTLLQYVKTRLPSAADSLMRKETVKKEMTEMQKKASKQTNVVLQEEYELTQRRFMRHIIDFVSKMDSTPMPRLVVIDFDKTDRVSIGSHRMSNRTSNADAASSPSYRHSSRTYNTDTGSIEREGTKESIEKSRSRMSRPTLRPKTATKSKERMEAFRPDLEDWQTENFCVKLLCEFEEGWHLCEHSFPLRKTEESKDQLKKLAPYLARIFAILKQSSMPLSCLSSENGKQFIEWLEQESQGSDFLEAYQALRAIITEHELAAESFLNQLSRCHLPSGKVFWLCEKHQSGPRITKLSRDVGTRLNQRRVVFREDVLLKELIEKSATYLKKKGEKAKQAPKKVYLPPTDTTKSAEKKLEHKTSAGNLSNSKSQEEITPPGADNSENMAPVRGSTNGKQKEAKSPPPTKMHPVNRTKSKPKFKAVGSAAGTASAASKAGSEKGSKACTLQ